MKYYKVSLDIPRQFGMSLDNLITFKNLVDNMQGLVPQKIA